MKTTTEKSAPVNRWTGSTPWGAVQTAKELAPGIVRVSTASHGGYILTERRLAEMPTELRAIKTWAGPGFYEEDCDWAIVALAFPQFFSPAAIRGAILTAKGQPDVAPWLETEAGKVAVAVADSWEEANADRYEAGCEGTGGNGWFVMARRIRDGAELRLWFSNVPTLPGAFTMDEAIAAGGKEAA